MRRSDHHTALNEEIARFEAEVQRLALAVVREIVKEELERRQAGGKPARRRAASARDGAPPRASRTEAAPPREAPTVEAGAEQSATKPDAPAAPPSGKRQAWTRESVIGELASWMASGTEIDASFVTRHGPPGLVAATRRIFGRFEAALNVAGLHVSKLYPDGPPAKPGVTHDERKRVARNAQAAEWSAQSAPAVRPRQDS